MKISRTGSSGGCHEAVQLLLLACEQGDWDGLQIQLKARVSDDFSATDFNRAISLAMQYGNEQIIGALISVAGKRFGLGCNSHHAIEIAAAKGFETVVDALIELSEHISDPNQYFSEAFVAAANGGHSGVIRALVSQGKYAIDINGCDRKLLIIAAEKGHADVVRAFAELAGDPITLSLNDCDRLLKIAATWGYLSVAHFLLECLNLPQDHVIPNIFFREAFHEAARNGHDQIVRALVDCGGYRFDLSSQGISVFFLAVEHNHPTVVRTLLELSEPSDSNISEHHAIIHAAEHGYLGIIQTIFEFRNRLDDRRALIHSAIAGHSDVVCFLLEQRAKNNVNPPRPQIQALMGAIRKDRVDVVRHILMHQSRLGLGRKSLKEAYLVACTVSCPEISHLIALFLLDSPIRAAYGRAQGLDNQDRFVLASFFAKIFEIGIGDQNEPNKVAAIKTAALEISFLMPSLKKFVACAEGVIGFRKLVSLIKKIDFYEIPILHMRWFEGENLGRALATHMVTQYSCPALFQQPNSASQV